MDRRVKELVKISQLLETTDIINKFKLEKLLNNNELSKVLAFCSINILYKFLEKDKFLFRQGDYGDKFYIILKGSVNILQMRTDKILLNVLEYFKFLKGLHLEQHTKIFKKNIKDNIHLTYFDIIYSDQLDELIFILELVLFAKNDTSKSRLMIDYENFFLDKGRTPEDYNLHFRYENHTLNQILVKIKKYSCSKILIQRFNFESMDFEPKFYLITNNEKILSIKTGNFFGDFALDNQSKTRFYFFIIQNSIDTSK